ncbi:MAG: pyruvate:ferredoxin (flavodoxin) oxidoreductase [Thermoguttaceae bacterium]|nr:pyruvate:ferredoxin (flavodoxin) oxidoreductase [Thermoguttaceae bacterium]MDW8078490.1 pyruvate:ferredoxin (flavodoxin) oxidoreductase [Thermoguttaceae bacterium]
MKTGQYLTLEGNEATAAVAHLCNEVMAIYPITPSSTLGELPDEWASKGRKNLFGVVPTVVEMQSEAGAAAAVHGALQAGALSATFTASQGLLLMIPNMFKIAGELTPAVFHVTARTVATHALSIFGDHSDVMAVRSTGWALLAAGSVQEAQDLAMIAYAASLESRIPFLHFYDGFRISHEVNCIQVLTEDQVRAMLDPEAIRAHRLRAMNPERPVLRGTAQNPDVFFQSREACNPFYFRCPEIVQKVMDRFAAVTGRQYHLFDYVGAPDADRVIVIMSSGGGVVEETVEKLNSQGERVGVLKVRLFRPFDGRAFVRALPKTVRVVAAMDRTKEPGAIGEPLYLDVVAALTENWAEYAPGQPMPLVIGGRYGLSSKEFTPAMAAGIFEEMKKPQPKRHFTVGIHDDVTHLSLPYDPNFSTEAPDVTRAVFFGLGADGTVGSVRNTCKIIGENTPLYAQAYFVYDSRKAGSLTTSHLRISPRPIKGSYLISRANFVGCHQFVFLERFDVLSMAEPGATFLLNSPFGPDEVWNQIPAEVQEEIIRKKLRFWVVDAYRVAREAQLGVRINTIMQVCFFKLSGVLPIEEAVGHIKEAIVATYGKKGGSAIIERNFAAVDRALDALAEVHYPQQVTSKKHRVPPVPEDAPAFVKNVLGKMIANKGDELPVSALPVDGTYPTGTTRYEKRSIALEIPIWDPELCTQCGFCSLVCPHGCIRMKVYPPSILAQAPNGFKSTDYRGKEFAGWKFTVQVAPDDCTGCGLCVQTCPAKDKQVPKHKAIDMLSKFEHLDRERACWDFFFNKIPDVDREQVKVDTIKGSQLLLPLFEFSGACAGCGETPYVKLITQLFGDRMMIANATGCSSIYGGNLPCTPYCTTPEGRGPTWNNSLFEDAAEFGFGFRLAVDQMVEYCHELLRRLSGQLGDSLVSALINNPQESEGDIRRQRQLVAELKRRLAEIDSEDARNLLASADYLIRRSIWSFGGDGWAYDIGFGGLDHVLASGRDINLLVMDTEVYSNTGGQSSKSTPRGAVAKFAASGKPSRKKDLGLMAMSYGNVFVGQIAMGANPMHALRTIIAAESYRGPSLIIALCHCIGWGIDMVTGLEQQKEAVACGAWPLYHYDPRDKEHPFHLDSKPPSMSFKEFALKQARFAILARSKPDRAEELFRQAQEDIWARWRLYEALAQLKGNGELLEAIQAATGSQVGS